MTTAEPLYHLQQRLLNKGSEYFRSTSAATPNAAVARRKTAAERLEADKLKYVKSAAARQRRATLDTVASFPQPDSPGPQSTATSSTDDDVSNSVSMQSRQNCEKSSKTRHTSRENLYRPNGNTDTSTEQKSIRNNQLRPRSATEQLLNTTGIKDKQVSRGSERRDNRSVSPKDSRSGKSLSAYLSKAKEGLKAVTSTIAGAGNEANSHSVKTRQPRSTVSKPSRHRSASAGPTGPLRLKDAPLASDKLPHEVSSESVTMSPRTQLKHVRDNLKKVKTDENKKFPPPRQRRKTFTVAPRQNTNDDHPKTESSPVVKLRQTTPKSGRTPRNNGRPFSVIENRAVLEVSHSSPSFSSHRDQQSSGKVIRRKTSATSFGKDDDKSSEGNDVEMTSTSNSGCSSARKLSSYQLKRRSWDLAHTMDNSLHLSTVKPTSLQPTSLTPDADVMLCNPLINQPHQRKSWSRAPPPPTSDHKKNDRRVSIHEDSNPNRSGSRKNITEALEEILNPLDRDDDRDTAYNSMSPDASVECKTLVGQAGGQNYVEKSGNSVAASINSLLRGVKTNDRLPRSKSPESSRSRTPTCDDGISFEANDVDIREVTESSSSPERPPNSHSSPSETLNCHKTVCRTDVPFDRRHWAKEADVRKPIASQPLNRIDLAPGATHPLNAGIPSSPMLAPRSRREVAPDCAARGNPPLSRSVSRDDHVNTMKSQNTSSSNSGDINKPLTALTASDLKPRVKRSSNQQPTPIRPTCPYPVNNYRGSPKRHNNTPVSPTLSPNKQPARMTPPQSARSTSSTPYSSLKRTPTSSRSSSLKRNRQRSKSDVSVFQTELDRFFSSMGMEEGILSPFPGSQDTLFTTAHVSSESDFSFAGASAYVRDSADETMDVDPVTAGLASVPTVSIIEKNARVMRWLMSCKKSMTTNSIPRSPKYPPGPHVVPSRPQSSYNPPLPQRYPSYPPPIPPRVSSFQTMVTVVPKQSDV